MDSWFSGNVSIAPKYGLPDTTTISMDWVPGFLRARKVHDRLMKERIWANVAAQKEIVESLRRKGMIAPSSTGSGSLETKANKIPWEKTGSAPRIFGDLKQIVQFQDEDYINHRMVGFSAFDLNDMSAALANFFPRHRCGLSC